MLVSIGSRLELLLFDRRNTLGVRLLKPYIQLAFFLKDHFGYSASVQ